MVFNDDASRSGVPALSKQEQQLLAETQKKFDLVKDNTAAVAMGHTNGFYLYGPGGCGKSYNVTSELKRLGKPYQLFNSRMTGRGLYNALEAAPDEVHLLEDMEQLFYDKGAMGVLRSALWGQGQRVHDGPMERLVTWTTYKMEHEFVFTGGIIMTGNLPFPDTPQLDAVRTRIRYLHLTLSDNEIIALMKSFSLKGVNIGTEFIEPNECWMVCDFIVSECLGLNRSLHLRLFEKSLSAYLQWRECQSRCDWRDLVSALIKERPIRLGDVKSVEHRSQQKQHELQLAQELSEIDDPQECLALWVQKTGKSQATMYRRLAQVKDE